MQQIVCPAAPSIPSHDNVFGYEEDDKGRLIKQTNQDPHLSGVGDEKAGPGHYI